MTIGKEYDYIIVGQGLAGTLLHFELSKQGARVLMIDNFFHASSSLVAAGMYNPIVFKRLNKSWQADKLLPQLQKTYNELEDFLGVSFHQPIDIVRIFANIEQQNDWMARAGEMGFNYYLTNDKTDSLTHNNIPHEYGYGILKQSGWVNLQSLLSAYREHLKQQQLLLEQQFNYQELTLTNTGVLYQQHSAKRLIFCEGNHVKHNPYFNHLPFTLTKGELLTIKINELDTASILNRGFFILPIGDNTFKVGATYNWRDKTLTPTESGKTELLNKLKTIITSPFNVLEHKAGIRPTTKDRRPIIGQHKEHNQLHIFNGLGTKGVMIAPYYVQQFVSNLTAHTPLDKEVNLNRFG